MTDTPKHKQGQMQQSLYNTGSMRASRITILSFALFLWLHCHGPVSEGYIPPQQRPYRPQKSQTHFIFHSKNLNLYLSSKIQVVFSDDPDQPQINTAITRQSFLRDAISFGFILGDIILLKPDTCHAVVETIGKDPNCNDASCLGVWDGLLANCDHSTAGPTIQISNPITAGCVSSQDDTPGTFAEPWDYSDDTTIPTPASSDPDTSTKNVQQIIDRIINAIECISNKRGDTVEIVLQEKRYLHVLFTDQQSGEISDGEFYITPNDTTIQFRLSSARNSIRNTVDTSVDSSSSRRFLLLKPSLKNIERAELIRKELRWLKLPILRNRQRALFFVESAFDKFGPQSAALGPPEEMKINDINGN
jgi:uncharacterized protein (DUF1499 family)